MDRKGLNHGIILVDNLFSGSIPFLHRNIANKKVHVLAQQEHKLLSEVKLETAELGHNQATTLQGN